MKFEMLPSKFDLIVDFNKLYEKNNNSKIMKKRNFKYNINKLESVYISYRVNICLKWEFFQER